MQPLHPGPPSIPMQASLPSKRIAGLRGWHGAAGLGCWTMPRWLQRSLQQPRGCRVRLLLGGMVQGRRS